MLKLAEFVNISKYINMSGRGKGGKVSGKLKSRSTRAREQLINETKCWIRWYWSVFGWETTKLYFWVHWNYPNCCTAFVKRDFPFTLPLLPRPNILIYFKVFTSPKYFEILEIQSWRSDIGIQSWRSRLNLIHYTVLILSCA